MSKREILVSWVQKLEPEEMRQIIVDMTTQLLASEDLRITEDSGAPYWDSTGDRVDGKKWECNE